MMATFHEREREREREREIVPSLNVNVDSFTFRLCSNVYVSEFAAVI